jgi:hypothetical protein
MHNDKSCSLYDIIFINIIIYKYNFYLLFGRGVRGSIKSSILVFNFITSTQIVITTPSIPNIKTIKKKLKTVSPPPPKKLGNNSD